MKNLIYELFSGVGLCNQLFSLETAIYLANISNRRLILLVRYPFCHCGRANWDYGYLLNYFTNDFQQYLPNGFEVYYKYPPQDILNIINDTNRCHQFKYIDLFSEMVFVDKVLDTPENANLIKDYCHSRKKASLNFDAFEDFEFFYMDQSNASRCFYNFYTSQANYILMYNICKSIKFKTFFYDIADNLYRNFVRDNKTTVFLHLRFGDNYESNDFFILTRNNKDMIENISAFIDKHTTQNDIISSVYALVDNKNLLEGGEIGSGSNVLAIFEIVPTDSLLKMNIANSNQHLAEMELRYSISSAHTNHSLRYKALFNFVTFDSIDKPFTKIEADRFL